MTTTYTSRTSSILVNNQERRVHREMDHLLSDIRRIKPQGAPYCTFGELFVDPRVEQYYEALVGTLKAAKRNGLIAFKGQFLLKGVHDDVIVHIVEDDGNAFLPESKQNVIASETTDCTTKVPNNVRKMWQARKLMKHSFGNDKNLKQGTNLTDVKVGNSGDAKSTVTQLDHKQYCPNIKQGIEKKHTVSMNISRERNSNHDDHSLQNHSNGIANNLNQKPETNFERVEREINQLLVDILRIAPEGSPFCTFGPLFEDPQVEQYYEALVGTLKSAKRKGLIQFKGQMLLKGMHDNIQIEIVK